MTRKRRRTRRLFPKEEDDEEEDEEKDDEKEEVCDIHPTTYEMLMDNGNVYPDDVREWKVMLHAALKHLVPQRNPHKNWASYPEHTIWDAEHCICGHEISLGFVILHESDAAALVGSQCIKKFQDAKLMRYVTKCLILRHNPDAIFCKMCDRQISRKRTSAHRYFGNHKKCFQTKSTCKNCHNFVEDCDCRACIKCKEKKVPGYQRETQRMSEQERTYINYCFHCYASVSRCPTCYQPTRFCIGHEEKSSSSNMNQSLLPDMEEELEMEEEELGYVLSLDPAERKDIVDDYNADFANVLSSSSSSNSLKPPPVASPLTDEQRQRIEKNRQRAIAIRLRKQQEKISKQKSQQK